MRYYRNIGASVRNFTVARVYPNGSIEVLHGNIILKRVQLDVLANRELEAESIINGKLFRYMRFEQIPKHTAERYRQISLRITRLCMLL